MELEYAKRLLKSATCGGYFLALFAAIQVGRVFFEGSLTFLWVVVGLIAILTMRMFFINRYFLVSAFGGIFMLIATMAALSVGGLFVLFGPLARVMDNTEKTSIVLFLGTLLISAGLATFIYYKVSKPLEAWANRKLYESIEAELRGR